jgi:hypothetical protein
MEYHLNVVVTRAEVGLVVDTAVDTAADTAAADTAGRIVGRIVVEAHTPGWHRDLERSLEIDMAAPGSLAGMVDDSSFGFRHSLRHMDQLQEEGSELYRGMANSAAIDSD